MQQQPIFPDRLQSSIVGASELNYCVRYENRWDLTANVTAMVYIGFLRVYRFLRCISSIHSFLSVVKFFTRQINNCIELFLISLSDLWLNCIV